MRPTIRHFAAGTLAVLLAACAAPAPTGVAGVTAPPRGPAATPMATANAAVLPTTCHNDPPGWWAARWSAAPDGSPVPVAITLTCERAVAAAWAAVTDRAAVISAEFAMGDHCLPEMMCPASDPNTGQVVFHLRTGGGIYIVVGSDAAGTVTVEHSWGFWNGWPAASP